MALNLINLDRLNRFWSDLKTWLSNKYYDKDEVDQKITDLGTVLTYIGPATVVQLNTSGFASKKGAVYSVSSEGQITSGLYDDSDGFDGYVRIGDEVAWSASSKWVLLGNSDLSRFLTESDLIGLTVSLYQNNHRYVVNEVVLYNRQLYYCSTEIPVGDSSWTQAHWTKIDLGKLFKNGVVGLVPPAVQTTQADRDKVLDATGSWVTRLKSTDLDAPTNQEIEDIFDEEPEEVPL